MFADTLSDRNISEPSSPSGFNALKRVVARLFARSRVGSAEYLTNDHYRDLGLPQRGCGADDIRPLIIIGPM
jgi:hypothetical protein